MPPTDRFVPRFAAEPPQEPLPYGQWAQTLGAEFLAACRALDTEDEDVGEPGELTWFPDRTYGGRTYVPVTSRTSNDYELFGYVSFVPATTERGAGEFQATADFTAETAEANPEWQLDLSDEVIGGWRGEEGKTAQITLVWGVSLVRGGAIATAELADLAVDQCVLVEDRFSLIAPDAYRSDLLDIKLFDVRGGLLATESLYVVDDEDDENNDDEGAG